MSFTIQQFKSKRGCLSYIVSEPVSKKAAIIDPSVEVLPNEYILYLENNCLSLVYIIETHTHADHISAASILKTMTNTIILLHPQAPSSKRDQFLEEGFLELGKEKLKILYTPGHTDDSISIVAGNSVFTGDTLLLGGTGRTDFQKGSSEALYDSLWTKILTLEDTVTVYPAHSYTTEGSSTIGAQKIVNPRLKLNKKEFTEILNAHRPAKPELFNEAIRSNSQ